MVIASVSSKSVIGALDGFGKGLLVSFLVGASTLTQASAVTDQSLDTDSGSGSAGYGMKADFLTSPNFSGAVSASFTLPSPAAKPTLTTAILKPPVVDVVTQQIVASTVAVTQLIVAAATPPIAAGPAAAPVVAAKATEILPSDESGPAGGNISPAVVPSVLAVSVPEPSTVALLLAGFMALVGVRRIRGSSNK